MCRYNLPNKYIFHGPSWRKVVETLHPEVEFEERVVNGVKIIHYEYISKPLTITGNYKIVEEYIEVPELVEI
jgi:hypothetical protein